MGQFLIHSDLSALAPQITEAQANEYIEDIEALALVEAPCIAEAGFPYESAVKAILRQAVLRWHRAGEGGMSSTQQTAGVFSQTQSFDNRSRGEGRLYASEIKRLKALCRLWKGQGSGRKAFTVAPR